ncbi:MAG: glycogen/starch synthase [Thermodesulfobacteriota bacterium]
MKILFVTPELYPFARAGGLADVSYHLPRTLADRGHQLSIITPKYRSAEEAGLPLVNPGRTIPVPISYRERTAHLFTSRFEDGVDVIFVGCDDLYGRLGLYGNEFGDYEDNAERFIFFSRAVMEFIRVLGLEPDIIHCHDWPSGLVPIYVRTLYRNLPNLRQTATIFTFHNLGSQGIFWHYDYALTGLGWDLFTPDRLEFHNQMNLTKAGLIGADLISTVSRNYAREVLTPEYGFGLEGVLQARQAETYAVLNGVDYEAWDPARDPHLAQRYDADHLHLKAVCRRDLGRTFGLDQDERPIVAVVSRLLDRKGLDLISASLESILELPLKLVFMGRGEERYHYLLSELSRNNPGRVGALISYDQTLVNRIMAGADIFLMPSRYEPCGLEQLYAMKYGTIPVVRATGGLDDTVIDVTENPESGTGFKFYEYSPEALRLALAAATDMHGRREDWTAMMRRGMAGDFSWAKSAAEYEEIYRLALAKVDRA